MKYLNDSEKLSLREFLPNELEGHEAPDHHGNNGYICPACGSGTKRGARSTGGVSYYRSRTDGTYMWKCKSCGKVGDVCEYVQLSKGIDKTAAFTYVRDKYYDRLESEEVAEDYRQEVKSTTQAKPKRQPLHDYTEYLKRHPLFSGSREYTYLENRGLTPETIRRFKLGFDSQITYTNKHGLEFFGNTILIPFLDDEAGTIPYVTARFIDSEVPTKYKNPSVSKAGKLPIWNPSSLYIGEVCFVVEGIFDALSILQVGGEAISLNGEGNGHKLIEVLRERPTTSTLIICLDNDGSETTAKNALELTEQLQSMGFDAICDNSICGQHKDPNEFLAADPEGFKAAVQAKIEQLRAPKIGASADL